MRTRREFVAKGAVTALCVGTAGCLGRLIGQPSGGDDIPTPGEGGAISLSAPAFESDEIPAQYTCTGADTSPPLNVTDVPRDARALALVVDDPDAPGDRPYVHWLLWNLPVGVEAIPEGVPHGAVVGSLGDARQGTNSADAVGYTGPCPPPADGAHTYRFILYALDAPLDVEGGARRPIVDDAIRGARLDGAVLTAAFERSVAAPTTTVGPEPRTRIANGSDRRNADGGDGVVPPGSKRDS